MAWCCNKKKASILFFYIVVDSWRLWTTWLMRLKQHLSKQSAPSEVPVSACLPRRGYEFGRQDVNAGKEKRLIGC